MNDDIYLTVEEVARKFGINPTTVYRLAQKGTLPAFKLGNQWRFSQSMLRQWIEQQAEFRGENPNQEPQE